MVMKKRTLGRSGIEVSALGLGVMRLTMKGWYTPDEKEAVSIINMAIDQGVNVFDTHTVYSAGYNEKVLGKGIAAKRDKVVIISKGGSYILFNQHRINNHLLRHFILYGKKSP